MARVTTVRFSDREFDRLLAAATEAGQSQSSFVRLAVEHEIERENQTARLAEMEKRIVQRVEAIPSSLIEKLGLRVRPAQRQEDSHAQR